jgi:hypothetical protein
MARSVVQILFFDNAGLTLAKLPLAMRSASARGASAGISSSDSAAQNDQKGLVLPVN